MIVALVEMQTEFYSLRLSKIFVRLSTCDSQVQGLVEGGMLCQRFVTQKRVDELLLGKPTR